MIQAPTEEQRAEYKALYKAYIKASAALHASRQAWLPDKPPNPEEDMLKGSRYTANFKAQLELIAEADEELRAEAAGV